MFINKKKNPLVSVIIPTYKRNELIERAIDSVLKQTYNNIEIIIIDDNGNNIYRKKTKNKIQKYLKFGNVLYYQHKINKGGSQARNTGIKLAKGKFITFLDDDDYYLPNRIEILLKNFDVDDFDAVISSMYRENIYGKKINVDSNYCRGSNLKEFILEGNIYTSMILIKKDFIKKIGGFDPIPRFQDKLFMIKFFENNGRARLLKDQLHVMVEHENERITFLSPEKGRLSHKILFNKIIKHRKLFSKKEWRRVKYIYYYGLSSVSAQGNLKNRILCLLYFTKLIFFFIKDKRYSKIKLLFRCFIPQIVYRKVKNIQKS